MKIRLEDVQNFEDKDNGEQSKEETTLGSDVDESTDEYKNLREVTIRLEDVQNITDIRSKNATEDITGEGEDKDISKVSSQIPH